MVEILNDNRPWVVVHIGNMVNIKVLLEISTLYIPDHKDLVFFHFIINKPSPTIYLFIAVINTHLAKKANYYVSESKVAKFLCTI